jgi:hypothetical protein
MLLSLLLICSITAASLAANGTTTKASGSKSKPKTTPVPLPEITPVHAYILKENDVAVLQCSGAQVIAWYKGATQTLLTNELKDEKGNPGKYVIADSTLNVTRVGRADVGFYFCYDSLTRANYTVHLYMAPTFVRRPTKSVNMAQGDVLVLSCDTYGWPLPSVSWFRSKSANEIQILTVNTSLIDKRIMVNGSVLMINPAIQADYMMYTCVVNNSIGAVNSTTLVRVKGRFTAIWPFIGVVVEVAILIGIIVFYEKKKAKEIAKKQAQQAENEKLINSAQGNDAIRQRK